MFANSKILVTGGAEFIGSALVRFLFASSACLYAERSLTLNKFAEEDAYPANPPTTSGWAKLMGEIQCKLYFLDYGIKSASARIGNAFGERESFDVRSAHVIPSLIRKALEYPQERFVVFGDGKQERAFLYVSDCVDGLIRCMEKISDGAAINLGSGEIVSVDFLAKQIISLSAKDVTIEYDLAGPQGTHKYRAFTSRMRKVFEWSLEGLRTTLEWGSRKIVLEK